MAQRNSATEKKRLENLIVHLESRIAVLEDVINNPDESAAANVLDETADDHDATSPVHARTSLADGPESVFIASNASSPDNSSPLPSPTSSEAAQLIFQLQEENQKLADSKLSAQLQ
jgi:hypothetical protein